MDNDKSTEFTFSVFVVCEPAPKWRFLVLVNKDLHSCVYLVIFEENLQNCISRAGDKISQQSFFEFFCK